MSKRLKGMARRKAEALGSTSRIMDGIPKAKNVRVAARRARKFKEKQLGVMGAASECVSITAGSPEFAEIAARYATKPETEEAA